VGIKGEKKEGRDPVTGIEFVLPADVAPSLPLSCERRHAKPRCSLGRASVACACVDLDEDDEGRTKILAICVATAATLRRMHVGGGERGGDKRIYIYIYMQGRGASSLPHG